MADIPTQFAGLGGREVAERVARPLLDILARARPDLTALHPAHAAGRVAREAREPFAAGLVPCSSDDRAA